MQPKFEIGEVVILQSVATPQYNGEYTVIDCLPNGAMMNGWIIHSANSGFGYVLDGYFPDTATFQFYGESVWDECALRKKHLPGTMSFTDLMQSLKQPQTEWV